MKSYILHLTQILFALFLCGCAATTSNHDPLPDFLVGEWVSPDFKAPPNPAQEPRDGFILYLLANGNAGWIAEPEIGSRCTATYHPNTRTLILTGC